MPKVRYVGSHDAIEIPSMGLYVERGDVIDVPTSGPGADFVTSNDWQSVDPKADTADTPEEG